MYHVAGHLQAQKIRSFLDHKLGMCTFNLIIWFDATRLFC